MTKILSIDDTAYNLDILKDALEDEGYDVVLAENGEAGLRRIEQDRPDLVLLDIKMSDMDGLTLLETLRANEKHRNLPIIMVTADTRDETLAHSLRAGANDFVSKPVNLDTLSIRIKNVLRHKMRQELAIEPDSETVTSVMKDPLTGALRPHAFLEAAGDVFYQPRQSGEQLSTAILKLDRFEQIGQQFGQKSAHTVLQAFCRLLRDELRHSYVWGHLEATKFGIAMPATRAVHAFSIVEGLRLRLNELDLIRDESGDRVPVSFSAGIAALGGQPDLESLLKDAETALHRAEDRGRNKTLFKTHLS